MGKLILYSQEISPPCRAILMTGAALGLDFDIRSLNLLESEQFNEDFLKINPQHTLPTLIDGDYVIWDSHAIMCYLCNKYAKDDSLYPEDPQKRALVDQRLHFDSGVIFNALRSMVKPLVYFGATTVPQKKLDHVLEVYDFLNKFLNEKTWLAGDNYTLADISCVSTVSGLTYFRSLDAYPNVKAWLKRCEEKLPGYQKLNAPGNKQLHDFIRQKCGGTLEKNI